MLELSDVYYPEGGSGANDAYDYDDDDDDGHARRSAVTFDVGRNRNNKGGESSSDDDDEEPVDFNPPSDNDNEEEKKEALTTTPKDDNVEDASSQASAACPETATKSQRDALLLLSGASADMGGGAGTAAAAAEAVDTTVLPGERNSLMGGLGLSARSANDADGTLSHRDEHGPTFLSGASQPNHNLDRTVRPNERASLLGGLGLSAASGSALDHDQDRAREPSIAGTDAGAGASSGGRRLDATVLLGQKDSLLNTNNTNNTSDLEDFCTAASKQDVEEDEEQMTDGTATTSNTNRYFTGREEDGSEDEEDGQRDDDHGDDDSDATDIDEDVVGQDSEATVSHSMPSPSTERKSNISRSRNNSSSNLPRLSRVDTMDSTAGDEANPRGDLSTLEEGSCETSMNTTGTSNVSHQAKSCGGHADASAGTAADDTIQEPSQCQSLVGHVQTMERRLDSALADAMRSPSPRVNTSGRSGLDQSCAIPQGDDFQVDDDDESPVFGSQGLSPIMLAGSQMDPTFDYEEEAEEEELDEDQDQKPKAKSSQNDSKPIDESKPESPPNSDTKKRKAATPSNTARGLRESTRASSAECEPRVFFLSHSSALSAAHVRTVRKCIKSNKLSPIGDGADHASGTDNSDLDIPYDFETPNGIASFISVLKATKDSGGTVYGVSTNSEYQYTDGYIVPRSFRYLLGVAAGLPMVDIDFLTNNANANSRGPMGRYLLPAGAGTTDSTDGGGPDDGGRSKRARRGPSDNVDPFRDPQSGCPYVVCGDTDAKEIGAPQRSIASKQGLFDGYTILLFGDFDHVAPTTSKAGGRKRRGVASSATAKVDDSNLYSQGRVSVLLQLSGATVAGLKEVVETSEAKASSSSTTVPSNLRDVMAVLQSASGRRTNDNIVVLVKCKATAKDYKQANRYLKDHGDSLGLVDSSKVPVLSADWALDSISDFFLRKCEEYSK